MIDAPLAILRSAQRFFSGTMISRITGLLRDITMAFAFGTHPSVAALMIAYRFAHLFRRLLGEGALHTAFIPHFEKLHQQNPSQAIQFFLLVRRWLLLLLFLLIITGSIVGLGLLQLTSLSPNNQEILTFTLLLLPSLLFICLFGLHSALLHTQNTFFTTGAAPVAFNLIWILFAWNLHTTPPSEAMLWMCLGIVLACLGQWLITLPQSRRFLSNNNSPSSLTQWFSPELYKLLSPLFFSILGIAALQVNSAIDPLFARYAHIQGPAWLWYSFRLTQLPLALFSIAFANALLPSLSRFALEKKLSHFRQTLWNALLLTALLLLPITFFLLSLGGNIIQLLFGHGNFDTLSTHEAYRCLSGYAIGLLPSGLILLLSPACYARKDYRTPFKASIFSMLINLILNTFFILFLKLGPSSVAFSTSFSALLQCITLLFFLKKVLFPYPLKKLLQPIGFILLSSLTAMLTSTTLQKTLLGGIPFSSLTSNIPFLYPETFLKQWIAFIYPAIAFGVCLVPFFFRYRNLFLNKMSE